MASPIQQSSARVYLPRADASAIRGLWASRRRFVIAAAGLLAVVVTNQADIGAHGFRVGLLNANWQFSWSHDVDTAALAAALIAALIGSRAAPQQRRLWLALAAILGLFFVDEISPLHGQIDQLPLGKALYSPILAGLVICIWLLAADTDERIIIGVGLTSLFVSFGMHVLGLHALRPLGYLNWAYQGGVGIKEGMELAGLILVVPGLWRLATRRSKAATGSG